VRRCNGDLRADLRLEPEGEWEGGEEGEGREDSAYVPTAEREYLTSPAFPAPPYLAPIAAPG